MTAVDLERALLLAGLSAPVRWDEVTGSTNDTAMTLAEAGSPEWTLVAAGHQTRGRGRLDRTWVDRPGEALMVSVVLRPAIAVADASVLPLLAGASWAEAVAEVGGTPLRCKWPNDLLALEGPPGAKAGGVLAASSTGPEGVLRYVVIGSGLNLEPPSGVPGAAGLGEVEPTELLAAFLRRFRAGYRPGEPGGFGEALDRWRAVADTLGRRVRVERLGAPSIEGLAVDVDARGSLIVDAGTNLVTVSAGEVQHLI